MSLTIHDTKLPRYLQVYSVLKDWIQNGRYAPTEKLPAEAELCAMLGVSRITTRRAMEMLQQDSLIYRVHGVGSFVREEIPQAAEGHRAGMTDLATRVKRLAERTKLLDVEVATVTPSPEIVRELRLETGESVTRVVYTRLEKKTPIGLAELYFPTDLGDSITANDIIQDSSPTLLQAKGIQLAGAHQLIGAELADETCARKLCTSVGAPLVRIRLLLFSTDQRPVQYLVAHYRAEAYEHHTYLTSL